MNSFERQPIFPEKNSSQIEGEKKYLIPEKEISEAFSRSSGKGGQNVNKVSTKVELRWNVDASAVFSEEEKGEIKNFLKNRLTKKGDLIITSQKERTQFQNREIAQARLNELVAQALKPEKERTPTKPTIASKEKRLEEKKRRSEKKRWRSKKPFA
ncbi:MAG: aminoacyl-tRNA hydrolase [Parcubacteria group bacterium CG08_land_8_20_14_0_20_38_56]|nr:MAG: aminoacyl-tRNA hydrolase [Parcubacteria group bacterium CG08_land_8_20_14_0_20_38_56]